MAIRSAIAYSTGALHNPQKPTLAKKLAPIQNRCLRKITGAYKDTPVENLEIEAFCPPLDLYFNKRVADFEDRLDRTGMRQQINTACAAIATALRKRRPRSRTINEPGHRQWAQAWTQKWCPLDENRREKPSTTALKKAWENRWKTGQRRLQADPRARASDLTPAEAFDKRGLLKLHGGLNKAQSSALVQARTGKIGLRAYLFHRYVPQVDSDRCPCGLGPQTPEHLFADCEDQKSASLRALGLSTVADVRKSLNSPRTAPRMARLLLKSGWLPEFRVAEDIRKRQRELGRITAADTRPSRSAKRRKKQTRIAV